MSSMRKTVKLALEEMPPKETMDTPKGVVVTVCKGDRSVEGTRIKMNAMEILLGFVKRIVPGCELMSDDNNSVMILPTMNEGDVSWLESNVMRYVSIVSTMMSKDDIARKTDELCRRFESAGGTPDKVGVGIIKRYLDKYYLIQRYASVFVRGV